MAGNIPETVTVDGSSYQAAGKLAGRTALVTGGDSGIGAAVAIAFAKEGAKVSIVYFDSRVDAAGVAKSIESYGSECLLLQCDVRNKIDCRNAVEQTAARFGSLDILVNNAGTQTVQSRLEKITERQLEETFRTNIFSMFYMAQAALTYLKAGSSIINNASVTAYRGSEELLDYSATKGAVVSFTRSLAKNLANKRIRVNAVAPGPVWTPLVLDSFDSKKLASFGKNVPLGRAAEAYEIAPAFVFLASNDASYVTGQVLHVNGGEIVNA